MMISEVEISKESFEQIGFGECYCFFSPTIDTGTVSLGIWGIDMDKNWLLEKNLVHNFLDQATDFYLSGMAIFHFHEVEEVSISTDLYEDKQGRGFIKRPDGSNLKLTKQWISKKEQRVKSNEYYIAGILDWPYGHCEITVKTAGKITLSFDPDHLINIKDFLASPQKFAYRPDGFDNHYKFE